MARLYKNIFFFIAIQVVVMLVVLAIWLKAPKSDLFHNNYLFGFFDNKQQLTQIKSDKRIVLLGGSSLGYSVSAKKLSEMLDVPAINLGVHAGLGLEKIIEENLDALNPDTDLILLSPEYGIIIDNRISEVYCELIYLNQQINKLIQHPTCLSTIFRESINDISSLLKNAKHVSQIYTRKGFNSYGDITIHYNQNPIAFSHGVITAFDSKDFFKLIKATLLDRGFKVLYIPTTIPVSYCDKVAELTKHHQRIAKDLDQHLTVLFDDLCYSDELFFNSIYHLNFKGVQKKTDQVYRAIIESGF